MMLVTEKNGDTAEIVELYESGWSARDIGERLHYGHSTVYIALIRAGVEMRKPGQQHGKSRMPHREFERTVELRASGMTLREVGQVLGRSEGAVSERLAKSGTS